MYENRIYENDYLSLIEKQAFERENIYAIEYLFKNNSRQYKFQIINALKKYLKKDHIAPIYYDIIYEILPTYQLDELYVLLEDELFDIQKELGVEQMEYFKKILTERE